MKTIGVIAFICAAGAFFTLAFACTDKGNPSVAASLAESPEGCERTNHFPCVSLLLMNHGAEPVEFPVQADVKVLTSHPGAVYLERKMVGGDWELFVDEVGTYSAPTKFIALAPGKAVNVILPVSLPTESSEFRVLFRDNDGVLFRTESFTKFEPVDSSLAR